MPLTFTDDRPPVPPPELISRVTGTYDDLEGRAFDLAGLEHLKQLERGLRASGQEFGDFERVLDFGCGPGRFIRHLGPLAEQVEIHGIDIDADAIAWAARHIDFADFTVGPHEPPTTYADGWFDLVLNHSVFTHLDARYQDLWLAELQRVTRPGGILLLTVHGTRAWNITRREHESVGEDVDRYLDPLERDGIFFYEQDTYVGSSHPDFYHSTFHAPWYVFEHWTRFFELIAYLPSGSLMQDLVVLRRREVGEELDEPIRRRTPASVTTGASAPLSHEPAAPARASGSEVRQRIGRDVGTWPPPRTLVSRVKRRLLRFERERQDRINELLAITLEETRAQLDSTLDELRTQLVALADRLPADPEQTERALRVMSVSLYEQGKRIGLVAREVRERTDGSSDKA